MNLAHSFLLKKHLLLTLSLFGFISLLSIAGFHSFFVSAAGANVLSNPGCETNTNYFSGYQASISRTTAMKRSGNASCKVTSTGGTYYIIESTQSIANPQKGQTYTATAWVRSDSNSGRKIYLSLRERGGSSPQRTLYGPEVILTTQWKQVTNTFVVQSTGRTALDFQVVQNPGSRNHVFYVDDMSFQQEVVPTLTPTPTPTSVPTATPIPPTLTPTPTASISPTNMPTGTLTPTPTAPVPTATSIPTPTPTSPSGQAMPVGDLPGWKQLFAEDFTVAAPLGSMGASCTNDGGWEAAANKIVYTGASGAKWKTYPDCFTDTYQKRPYRSDQVLSVQDGVLNFYLHPVNGQPAGANPSPIIDGVTQYQTYGRYVSRFKVDKANLNDYYAAWLLWPQSEKWGVGGDGEEDFPEGRLSSTVGGFHHCLSNTANNCGIANTNNAKFTEWHTYVMEWTPMYVKYILDGQVVLNYTNAAEIPNKPMRWQLQAETNTSSPNLVSGNLIVDWVAVYSYNPSQ